MPIKFRCQHCRQFLGISRAKAGAVVDCPTCGRTLRVPRLDGRVDPLPEPGMDPEDSRLSEALSELAQIAEPRSAPAAERHEDRRRSAAAATREEVAPLALPGRPDPLPRESQQPPQPASAVAGMKIQPLPRRGSSAAARPVPISTADVSPAAAPPAAVPATGTPKAIVPPAPGQEPGQGTDSGNAILQRARQSTAFSAEFLELMPLATEADEPAAAVSPTPVEHRLRVPLAQRFPRWVIVAALLCGIALVGTMAGFLLGRGTAPARTPAASAPSQASRHVEPEGTQTAPAPSVNGLAGRISYFGEGNTPRPDDGARVIAVPDGAPSGELLPAETLLDDDRQEDAAGRLAEVNGGFAVADAHGRFALALPNPGPYRVLIVSRWQTWDAQASLDPAVDAFVREWLDRPALVTAGRACRVRQIRYAGEGTLPFDCVFESRMP